MEDSESNISIPIGEKKKKKEKACPPTVLPPEALKLFPLRDDLYFAVAFGSKKKGDNTVWPRTERSIQFILKHLNRHGFGFLFDLDLDMMQLEYFFDQSWKTLRTVSDNNDKRCWYPSTNDVPNEEILDNWDDKLISTYYEERLYKVPAGRKARLLNCKPVSELPLTSELLTENVVRPIAQTDEMMSEHVVPSVGVSEDIVVFDISTDDADTYDLSRVATTNGTSVVPISTTQVTTAGTVSKGELKPIIFPHLQNGSTVDKHFRIKSKMKGVGEDSAVLCDVKTYVDFLEISLCMHAYLHYSADLPPDIRGDTVLFKEGMKEFIRLFTKYYYRGDASVDTDTCKIHCFLHLLMNTSKYGDPMQYESGKGERGLKEWAKGVSRTAQKTGLDIFIYQTVMRVADRLLISKVADIAAREVELNSLPLTTEIDNDSTSKRPLKKRKQPHFRYYPRVRKLFSVTVKGTETERKPGPKTISPNVINAFLKFEKESPVVEIWCELELLPDKNNQKKQFLRAHGGLDKFGSFYDWVSAEFEVSTNGEVTRQAAPAKLLAFYIDSDGDECCIVHAAAFSTGNETKMGNTRLVSNHIREFQGSGWPRICKIKLSDVLYPVYVIERRKDDSPVPPRCGSPAERDEYVVSVISPRREWATKFYLWCKEVHST